MTIPASGVVSAANILSELGLAANSAINLNDRRVRAFPGKQAGLIAFSDLRGRTRSSWSGTMNAVQWQTTDNTFVGFAVASDGIVQNGTLTNSTLNGMPIAQIYVQQSRATPSSCSVQVNITGTQVRANINKVISIALGGIDIPISIYWDYANLNGVANSSKTNIRPYAQGSITQAQYNTIRTAILNKSSTATVRYAT